MGPDLQDADGDSGGHRPAGASRGDHRDRSRERARGGGEEAQRGEEEEEGRGGQRVTDAASRPGGGVATGENSEASMAWARRGGGA